MEEGEDGDCIEDDQIPQGQKPVFENQDLENFDIDKLKEMWEANGEMMDNEKMMEEWSKAWEQDSSMFGLQTNNQ